MRRLAFILVCLAGVAWAAPAGPPVFDIKSAMETIRHLSTSVGIRHGGSERERLAVDYIRGRLEQAGYHEARLQEFTLPNGRRSVNLIVEKPGATDAVIVIGAHIDTKGPSPGANDNASGCAVILEVARALRHRPTQRTLRFIFFGAEEMITSNPDDHHYGSRYYVGQLSDVERQKIKGMINVDSVAAGPWFVIGNMAGFPPSRLARDMRQTARAMGVKAIEQRDPGWSDHEAFEYAHIPVAYVRYRIDPTLHTAGDNWSHISRSKVDTAGRVVLRFCSTL